MVRSASGAIVDERVEVADEVVSSGVGCSGDRDRVAVGVAMGNAGDLERTGVLGRACSAGTDAAMGVGCNGDRDRVAAGIGCMGDFGRDKMTEEGAGCSGDLGRAVVEVPVVDGCPGDFERLGVKLGVFAAFANAAGANATGDKARVFTSLMLTLPAALSKEVVLLTDEATAMVANGNLGITTATVLGDEPSELGSCKQVA